MGSYFQISQLLFQNHRNTLKYLKILLFSSLADYALQTKSQLLYISGSPPLFMESQKCWHSSMNIEGEQGFPLKVLLFTW